MDLVVNALADIAKHYAQKYINTDDNGLNIKVIGLVSILITILTGVITKLLKFDIAKTIYWFIEYKVLKKKVWVFPLYGCRMPDYFNPASKIRFIDIEHNDVIEVNKVIGKFIKKAISSDGNLYNSFRNITNGENNTNLKIDKNYIGTVFKKEKLPGESFECIKIAYINGYYIYLYMYDTEYYRFYSYSYETLNEFMDFLEREIKNPNNKLSHPGHKIWEFKTDAFNNAGYVKPELTMDNYVSRYKPQLLAKLNAFRDGTLFKNNPYLDNNLGILLHGGYGTGKSYLVSAIANYLGRDICNVNFTRIKTKTEFRAIINAEFCKKYVYCFDEFDYLLADIMGQDSNSADAKAEVQLKIHALTAQLASVKENKELSGDIIKQLKTLMEEGTSDNLSYPFILSELSGINSVTGRIIIATTNFIDRIPSALTRPGRFDYVLELNCFNSAEIRELLCKLYRSSEKETEKLAKVLFPEDMYTPSQIILKACEYPRLTDMVKYLISGKQL
jgi:DNA replication protein DnaC